RKFHSTDAWTRRRRRRRSCSPRDCQASSWSNWSSCSTSRCGQQGSQSRSRYEQSSASCGGAPCTDLYETRQCYGTSPVHCQLSSWSEWNACTTPCGVSGTQSSSRHRITTEQCGGSCTSTFRKTRACQQPSCQNGGSLKDGTCSCKEGYSGYCCEHKKDKINCQVSSWSEWGHCSTPCGVLGTQSSSRHRIISEQYGGTCPYTFQKTRACPQLSSCLNGGTLQHGTCSCTKDYTGHCCEKATLKHKIVSIVTDCCIALGAVVAIVIVILVYKKCKKKCKVRAR
ncbi:spondin-1-like, partial [Oculina patagonica]